MKMSELLPSHNFTAKTSKMAIKSRNYPIICIVPHCFRIMLKRNYLTHCKSFHNISLEEDLPEP